MQKVSGHFIWEDINIQELEKKHDITAKAKRDGMGDEPPSNAESFSVVENEIKQECETYVEKHSSKLRISLANIEDNQSKLSTYLQQNHFEPIYDKLKLEFDAIAGKKEMLLAEYKNSHNIYKEEQKQFQRYHQRTREPNFATLKKTMKAFGLILFLLIIEVGANSILLSTALIGGKLSGMTVAGSVAFVNVFMSFIVGYYLLKNVTHLEKTKRYFYGALSLLYATFIFYLNACLGAYRSTSEIILNAQVKAQVSQDASIVKLTSEQIADTLNAAVVPWTVDLTFTGLVLTILGISFAFMALIDGFTYNDSYPGFGNVGKKVHDYNELIKKESHEFSNEVRSLLDKGNKELQNKKDLILQNELNNWDSNTNLLQKEFITYKKKVNSAEVKFGHIIHEYRLENKRVRKTDYPKYFNLSFELPSGDKDPKIVFEEVAAYYLDDPTREKRKIEFAELIEKNFKVVEKEFEELVSLTVGRQKTFHEKYNSF